MRPLWCWGHGSGPGTGSRASCPGLRSSQPVEGAASVGASPAVPGRDSVLGAQPRVPLGSLFRDPVSDMQILSV